MIKVFEVIVGIAALILLISFPIAVVSIFISFILEDFIIKDPFDPRMKYVKIFGSIFEFFWGLVILSLLILFYGMLVFKK